MATRLMDLDDTLSARFDLEGFAPATVDQDYLGSLGVGIVPTAETLAGLTRGSQAFARRLEQGTLVPRSRVILAETDIHADLEVHNYTGACPTLTYEINPVSGCHVGCLYCLVTDGCHESETTVWTNYPALVARVLEERRRERHFFYFSPKTEALQEPTLRSGLAHEILRVFIRHYAQNPDSLARLFFASKAGYKQLEVRDGGESILDLFSRLRPWMQFNTSVSIMPDEIRGWLEPHAPPISERLAAVRLCQQRGIQANSALVQPILTPYLTDQRIDDFFSTLSEAGIINFKPELLTVNPECLAIIGQIVGRLDKSAEKALYEAYISPDNVDHKKQRDRTAPDRYKSVTAIERLLAAGHRHGLSASICFWVRNALGITEEAIPIINRNGFQCLGYQTRLFESRVD